jgi:Malonyl-CoA decarboxylase C-terminal domain
MQRRAEILRTLASYRDLLRPERISILSGKSIPAEGIVDYLSNSRGSIELAMALRQDIYHLKSKIQKTHYRQGKGESDILEDVAEKVTDDSELSYVISLESAVKSWLNGIFCPDLLEIRQITFDNSTGELLKKVDSALARPSATPTSRSFADLRALLNHDRKCFALFHKAMPTEPLIIVKLTMTNKLATTWRYIFVQKCPVWSCLVVISSINTRN